MAPATKTKARIVYSVRSTGTKKTMERCAICRKMMSSGTAYIYHVKRHSNNRPFSCVMCGKTEVTKNSLEIHMRKHINEKPFDCSACPASFKYPCMLRKHKLVVHQGKRVERKPKRFKCNICGKMSESPNLHSRHIRVHTNERSFKCPKCGVSYKGEKVVRDHLQSSSNATLFQCPKCVLKFTSLVCRKARFRRVHGKLEKTKCHVCRKSVLNLKKHLQRHTEDKPFPCVFCEKIFPALGPLTSHLRTHTRERPFACSECNADFAQTGQLQCHINFVHLKLRPFPCEMCEMSFAAKGDRDRHSYTHLAEKSYKCNHCTASFAHPSALHGHVRSHKNDMGTLRCPKCPWLLPNENNLRAHIIVRHNGNNECVFCSTLSNYANLEEHIRIHTKETVYSCKDCECSFVTYNQRWTHQRNVH